MLRNFSLTIIFNNNQIQIRNKIKCKDNLTLTKVKLIPLTSEDREQFIRDNQEAFNYGSLQEFGCRYEHFEEGEIISRKTIEDSIDNGEAYRIVLNDLSVGGLVIKVEGDHGSLDCIP